MIVLTLGVRPSALDTVYWSHTLHDLRVLTKLKMEHELVKANSFTESLVLVASQVFGGGNESSPRGPVTHVETAHDALAAVKDFL